MKKLNLLLSLLLIANPTLGHAREMQINPQQNTILEAAGMANIQLTFSKKTFRPALIGEALLTVMSLGISAPEIMQDRTGYTTTKLVQKRKSIKTKLDVFMTPLREKQFALNLTGEGPEKVSCAPFQISYVATESAPNLYSLYKSYYNENGELMPNPKIGVIGSLNVLSETIYLDFYSARAISQSGVGNKYYGEYCNWAFDDLSLKLSRTK